LEKQHFLSRSSYTNVLSQSETVSVTMNREQAINIIKQIFDKCKDVEGKSIKLMPPQENSALSNTFQIHIQTSNMTNDIIQTCVEDIAEKNNLSVKVKNGWLIMYKPYPNTSE
jgi:hypothetical protein